MHRHGTVATAYAALGLEQGASLEAVRTAYKQLALKTHPDKNQNNPDATVQFQQISSAYNVLLQHLDTSTPPPIGHPFSPFQHYHPYQTRHSNSREHSHAHSSDYDEGYEDYEDYEDYDDYDSEEFEYYNSDEEYYYDDEESLDFFRFLFEEMLSGRSNRFAGARFQARAREQNTESEAQYQERIKRHREEEAAAQQRRKAQEEAWKQRRQMERENEIRAGEERRKQKAVDKKVAAAASRKSDADRLREQALKSQKLRSSVFTAARKGDAETVRKAIWEDGVDAAGGELKPGMAESMPAPHDPKQTLLHIAVINGDAELVEWLDRHNAEADEQDSQGLTAFHLSLKHGHIPIVRYFLDTYPPKDSDSEPILLVSGGSKPLLRLALESGEPEVVWLVLQSELADNIAVRDTRIWISTNDEARCEFGSVGKRGQTIDMVKWEETKDLLISWEDPGAFTVTPPLTPKESLLMQNNNLPHGVHHRETSASVPKVSNDVSTKSKKKGAQVNVLKGIPTPPRSPATPTRTEQKQHEPPFTPQRHDSTVSNRGHNKGRGRVKGRGTGRAAP